MEFFSINNLNDELKDHITNSYTSTSSPNSSCPPCPSDNGGGDGGGGGGGGGTNDSGGTDNNNNNNIPDDNTGNGGNFPVSSSNSVKINGVKFDKCQLNNDKTHHCISDMYTYDDFGLPIKNNVAPTENNNLLYRIDGNYVEDPKTTLKKKKNCGEYGCCADGIIKAVDKNGSNCTGFTHKSNLTGSPISNLNNDLLGVNQKRVPFDSSSGNSYMDYINSHLTTPNIIESFNNKNNLAHNIIKYVLFSCIIIINILIIIYYVKKNKKIYK